LREAIAYSESNRSGHSVTKDQILVVHGATEGLLLSSLYFHATGRRSALILGPQFPTIFRSLEAAGLSVAMALGRRSEGFELDAANAASTIRRERPDVVALSQPTNPGGSLWKESEILEIVRASVAAGAVMLCDRVQADMDSSWWRSPVALEAVAASEGLEVVVVDSWSKRRSIPGLRLGYVFAPHSCIDWMASVVVGRTVSTVPLHAVLRDLQALDRVVRAEELSVADAQYVFEVCETHRVCEENRILALAMLSPWLRTTSDHAAGMNFWVELDLRRPITAERVATLLAAQLRLGSYPVECFVPGYGNKPQSSTLIRITSSSPKQEFLESVTLLVSALETGAL
jgi:aspartate/methionine/tyrosine aminotransferase